MKRPLLALLAAVIFALPCGAAEIIQPASRRFSQENKEVPDFRRHVVPLLGTLGCNGRACHGSFQGQGGFQLSLFGYDFKADHEAMTSGDEPRVYADDPLESLLLQKPTMIIDHEGGERMTEDGWQFQLLKQWIEGGAKGVAKEDPDLVQLEVFPQEIVFQKAGEKRQLRVVAHWSDGSQEDVTSLSRFRTNDESIAVIGDSGLITSAGKGDTHVVAFYDSGVAPVPVMLPVSNLVGAKYPDVPTPTRIDELVGDKLSKLGMVPSEECSDVEFLRRVSLDITGTLPSAEEVRQFMDDRSPDKRTAKIDELLERPAYAAWWTTRLCDLTGNNVQALSQAGLDGNLAARQWYSWMHRRVRDNVPYDEIVEGIVMAKGREDEQSYEDYCEEMSSYASGQGVEEFDSRETMPHYWMRRTFRTPEDMVLGFSYTFLGIQIQCAQCHKHPFDQWTKDDFDDFKGFFTRVGYGVAPDTRQAQEEMLAGLGIENKKKNGNDLRKQLAQLLKQGEVVPFPEVFVKPMRAGQAKRGKGKGKGKGKGYNAPPAQTARLLGGEQLDLTQYDDPRQALMDWIRNEPGRYFARAMVNRVWAAYFHSGIVNPPDDMNLANPPSNAALLDYLTQSFIEHGYDMKWLHREIAGSRTYQLSWQTNETNRLDTRNFSHAVPRRLPAEVAYDAIVMATAGDEQLHALWDATTDRAIGLAADGNGKNRNRGNYVLAVFGKPARATNCDCERSSEPTLLQAVYLRNDQEVFGMLDRGDGWLRQVTPRTERPSPRAEEVAGNPGLVAQVNRLKKQIERLRRSDDEDRKRQVEKLERRLEKAQARLAEAKPANSRPARLASSRKELDDQPKREIPELIQEAYLRTLSRPANDAEVARARQHIAEANDQAAGLRDLLWALINTKEFIVNH